MTSEITANIHIHTRYSDGTKCHKEITQIAAECGLDVIIITDHNIFVKGFDGYHLFKGKQILLITGEEIHDKNRIPQKSHLLAIGTDRSFVRFASDPQQLINKINEGGGSSFIAHAYDPALSAFGEDDLSWADWSVTGFTGMEIWNNLSEFKIQVKHKLGAIFFALFPQFLAVQPPKQIVERWDALLLRGQHVVGIGGADAHTLIYHFGPFTKEVFPYRYHFKTINTHILLDNPLSGHAEKDRGVILEALKTGRVFVANDGVKSSRGFRFTAQTGNQSYSMGSQFKYQKDLVFQARLPYHADCCLIRNGKVAAEFKQVREINFPVSSHGIYRLECYRSYLFRKRGWIFSNPITIE
jgi:hypothetical protein